MKFEEFGLDQSLLEGLEAMGFEEATPIQEKAIPLILSGKDLIACAQTGTGKTAAFLLPILNKLAHEESHDIDTLILVPTRELAMQIDQQLEGFAYFTPANSIPIYGGRDGASFEQEKKALKMGANIIVATPGRLIAHLQSGYARFDKLTHLILDEADRMLDMGFATDIMKIISYLPKDRQNLMFSATMPNEIRNFAKRILNDPGEISLQVSKPAENVLQGVYRVEDDQKVKLVAKLLSDKKEKLNRVLIFSSTKSKVKEVTQTLNKVGVKAEQIHSDLEQDEREEILRLYKNGKVPVLVATDILSRGIDVKNIELVINYDVPQDPEDYVHRVGRTARADSDGVALTFVNRKDKRRFDSIESFIGSKIREMPLPEGVQPPGEGPPRDRGGDRRHSSRRKGGGGGSRRGRGGGGNKRKQGGGGRGRGGGGRNQN